MATPPVPPQGAPMPQGVPAAPQQLPPMPRLTPAQVRALTPQQRAQLQQLQQLHAQRAAQQQAQAQGPPPVDPVMQATLDAMFRPVALKLADEERTQVACEKHGEETCKACGTDFKALNELAQLLLSHKELAIPPPPAVLQPDRARRVTKAKDEGNTLFKKNQHAAAIRMYTTAADFAAGRLPWEASGTLREELSMCICNRSAAYTANGEYANAVVDADAVIALKRPWSKGHFRKAKALVGAGKLQEAKAAIELGLQFEPDNEEMTNFLEEIERSIAKA